MLKGLPVYIPILFVSTTILTFLFFIAAVKSNNSVRTTIIISVTITLWLILHAVLGLQNFYTVTDSIPPRFALLVVPAILLMLILFITRRGRIFIDSLSPKVLTQLNIVRVFVEIVLWWLFIAKFVPKLMTFEGRNFDILAGITAPIVAWFGFVKHKLNKRIMLAWNIICLLSLLNIVVNAIFSAPFPFQKFAFDQPNVALLYFPFVWLPCFIVPVVLFSHLVLIRRLIKNENSIKR